MSATNHTTNYELPIFVGSDKPAWLVDWNGAMTAIDTAIHTAEGKADQAGTDIGGIESSISTINSTLTSINNAVSQLRLDTNANTGSINTINELIGNGTPTTTDHTLIGAINELNQKKLASDIFDIQSVTPTVTISNKLTGAGSNLKVLINSDGSVGKIYGSIFGAISTAISPGDSIASIKIPGLDTETAYDISGYSTTIINGTYPNVITYLHFNVGDTVDVVLESAPGSSASTLWMTLPPCLLFFKDLGD